VLNIEVQPVRAAEAVRHDRKATVVATAREDLASAAAPATREVATEEAATKEVPIRAADASHWVASSVVVLRSDSPLARPWDRVASEVDLARLKHSAFLSMAAAAALCSHGCPSRTVVSNSNRTTRRGGPEG